VLLQKLLHDVAATLRLAKKITSLYSMTKLFFGLPHWLPTHETLIATKTVIYVTYLYIATSLKILFFIYQSVMWLFILLRFITVGTITYFFIL